MRSRHEKYSNKRCDSYVEMCISRLLPSFIRVGFVNKNQRDQVGCGLVVFAQGLRELELRLEEM